MSRNFELLQQIDLEGKARDWTKPPEASRRSEAPDELAWPIVACERPCTKIPEAVRGEISKLIHCLFFTSEPPLTSLHAVVFSGFEQGDGPGRVTAIASDMLAEQTPNIRVCTVDADFRNPSLHDHFRISNSTGLADALQDPAVSSRFTLRVRKNLWIMPCGMLPLRANGHSLIISEAAWAVMADLRRNFDYVLMTAGSISGSSDTLVLGQAADGVIFVIEANCTRREIAEKYKESFQAADVRVLGTVLHNRTFPIPQRLYALL
jgi:Mrp family chromosome partitioning ATPase